MSGCGLSDTPHCVCTNSMYLLSVSYQVVGLCNHYLIADDKYIRTYAHSDTCWTYCTSASVLCMLCSLMQPDKKGQINSLSTVLSQEVDRFNNLLRVIKVHSHTLLYIHVLQQRNI